MSPAPQISPGTPGVPVPSPQSDDSALGVIGTRRGVFGGDASSRAVSGYGGVREAVQLPPAAQPPYGGWFDLVARRLRQLLPSGITQIVVYRGEITFYVERRILPELVKHLRDDEMLRFEALMSVSGVHYPVQADHEFHVVYDLLSMTHNRRIRCETTCPASDPHVPSIVATYPMADYDEREVWDMFGVVFDGHPGLTRILMPDDWVGHPQRKDYPLGGIPLEFKGAVVPPVEQREGQAR